MTSLRRAPILSSLLLLGHIKGAINSPSEDLEDDDEIRALIERVCIGDGSSKIVFHCMKSQERGPSCARRFVNRLAEYFDDDDKGQSSSAIPGVYVLQGGFESFVAAYSKDDSLCEDVDTNRWTTS